MMTFCNRISNWFAKTFKQVVPENNAGTTYNALTPTDEAKECGSYMDALSWALKQDKIHNIAISGPYGSGKSSVIRTFFSPRDQHSQYKHLTISLATFSGQTQDDNKPELQSRLIESSILEQLFYHEEDSHIPDSRFKKIRKQHRGKLFAYALAAVIFCLLVIFLFNPSLLSTWLFGAEIPGSALIWFNRIALGLCIIGAVYVLYKLARIVIGLSVKRLNFKSAEVEIENNTQKSVLNSHIDEIIYFFEVTGYQIVVLEDLDRFDKQDIFTKLREINYIINNSDKVKQKVVFIYAIKDDMFVNKDRTKFFDFIIPIIPVVNYSNSGEILRRELLPAKDTDKNDTTAIHEAIIDQLSLFIDDLRLLYNIINEYKIYRNSLSSTQKSNEQQTGLHLIADRLLAIIIYKNLYPQDFSDLSQGKGLLYNIISAKKDSYINAAIDKCNKEIAQKEERIRSIETSDRPFTAAELRLIYAQRIAGELHPNLIYFIINKQRKTISECAKDESLFNILISSNKVDFRYLNPSYGNEQPGSSILNFHDIEKKVHELTYQQRLDLLYGTELEELKKQIRALQRNIEEYKQYSIAELMREDKFAIDSKLTKDHPQQQIDFLNIVLREGYINENYWEYISVFYPGSLTYEDKQFVLDVFAGRSNSYDYHLNFVENVLKKITKESTKYLNNKASLNFDLMDYIVSDASIAYSEPYMQQISSHPDFVIQYIERGGKALGNFINLLCAYWPNFWLYVLAELGKDKDHYLNLILKHALEENIIPIFKDQKQYLEEYADFLLVDTESEKLHSLISELDLRFKELNPESNKAELEYVYSQGYYQTNLQILRVLLGKQDKWDESAFMARNYDYICDYFDLMSEHIHSNLSEYIDNVFLALDSQQVITSSHLVKLLNNENLSIEQKKRIIQKSECEIEHISEIADASLRNDLCRQKKMVVTWENVSALLNENEESKSACSAFFSISENVQQLLDEAEKETSETQEIVNVLSKQPSIDKKIRKQIFIKYASYITDVKTFLQNLGEPFSDIAEGKEITYIPTEDKKLLDCLKTRGHISTYKYTPGNKHYYIRNEWSLIPKNK